MANARADIARAFGIEHVSGHDGGGDSNSDRDGSD